MAKINRHIEIVTATKSGLSSMSLKSCQGAQAVLSRKYARVGITIVNDLSDLQALVASRPDLVFLGMKFIPENPELGLHDTNKVWVSQYLETHGISHTGSGQFAYELERNKELAKQEVLSAGLETARFYVARKGRRLIQEDISLNYPMFIKPTDRGGGLGVDEASLVHTFTQLRTKVASLVSSYNADALIEEYLPGREFSVAILRDEATDAYQALPLELIAPADKAGARILTSLVKSADTERHLAVTDPALRAALNTLALGVFTTLGAQDYGRIDIRLDAAGVPHFLEANLLPSLLAGYGNFPKACLLNLGLSYESVILQIVSLALTRTMDLSEEAGELMVSYPLLSPLAFASPALDVV